MRGPRTLPILKRYKLLKKLHNIFINIQKVRNIVLGFEKKRELKKMLGNSENDHEFKKNHELKNYSLNTYLIYAALFYIQCCFIYSEFTITH